MLCLNQLWFLCWPTANIGLYFQAALKLNTKCQVERIELDRKKESLQVKFQNLN